MALNPNIILGGQAPDIVGALDRSRLAAQGQIGLNTQNALATLYQQQGAGIAAGDPNSLNALARFDPVAAQGVQSNILGMQGQKQEMAFSAERMQMARDEGKAKAAEALQAQAANLTAEQLAAEKEAITKGLSGASFFYQNKDQAGYEKFLAENGMNPADFPFAEFPAHAAMFEGALEAMDAFAPPEPQKPADDYQRYVAEETAAGRQPLDRIGFANALKGKGVTMRTTNPDGSVSEVVMGGAQGGTGEPTVGQVYNPNEVASVVAMIDEISSNPNVNRVVGPIVGGGGNNIDDLNMAARVYYGGEGTALIERIGQLQNNAWLSARSMLKGGGAITDYESRKAEGAVARLSRAKSEEEFRAALKDLRDAITEGEAKLHGGQPAPTAQQPAPAVAPAPDAPAEMSDEELLRMYGG